MHFLFCKKKREKKIKKEITTEQTAAIMRDPQKTDPFTDRFDGKRRRASPLCCTSKRRDETGRRIARDMVGSARFP